MVLSDSFSSLGFLLFTPDPIKGNVWCALEFFLPFPDDLLSILLKLILNQVARSSRPSLSPWSNIRKLNHVVINDPGSSALRKELE